MEFFKNLGFSGHPFAHTNADEEPFLDNYFVPPPFFSGVLGDAAHPSSCVVLAPRGGGKSAQRRQVEGWASRNAVLAVTYDRFEFSKEDSLAAIGASYHLRNILVRTLVATLTYLSDYPDVVANMSPAEKQALALFIHSYLGDLSGGKFQQIVTDLKSLPERFRTFWSTHVGFAESVVNLLLKRYGLEKIDLPDLKEEQKKLSASYRAQLELLRDIVRKIGFKSVYVLIDRVDESEKTGNNAERAYQLVGPILRDLELLGIPGIGFKFFLWDQVLPYFRKDARPDRLPQYSLRWGRQALQGVLAKRLRAFSSGVVRRFDDLMSDSPGYSVDEAICLIANGSPRNVIRICERILSVQAEMDGDATRIIPTAVDRGMELYCEQIATEAYGEDKVKDIQRVGRELFTINFLANDVFKKTHENTSRNKVTAWQECGLVKQVGSVTVVEGRRPLNLYYVTDPSVVRLIHRATPMAGFLKDRWRTCKHCSQDNLQDVTLIPDGNDPVCHECGHALV